MPPIKLVVGLGNPDADYERTRHNAGFMAIDNLAHQLGGVRLKRAYRGKFGRIELADLDLSLGLLKPLTYMNRSGQSVGRAVADMGITPADILVIHDDMDIPIGRFKIKIGGGVAGHKGLISIKDTLGTGDFVRIRIGIGRPHRGEATDHVLGRFKADEDVILQNEVLPAVIEAVMTIFREGPEKAMNKFNRSDE